LTVRIDTARVFDLIEQKQKEIAEAIGKLRAIR